MRLQTWASILYTCWIKQMRHHLQIRTFNTDGGQKCLKIGEIWNPVCCHGNQTVALILWSTFSRIFLPITKHFWYKLAEITFSIIFDQNLVECMTSSLGSFAYNLKTLTPLERKEIFKKEETYTVFLLSYRNTSGSLGEQEMLWEHKKLVSVSTAFLSSPKLSRVFL